MKPTPFRVTRVLTLGLGISLGLTGCGTRSVDVKPLMANPAEFTLWSCARIDDELDRVQQRAADVAYAVDERAGNNILALSVGVTLFWPALLAMRPYGPEAAELGQLKGRDDALRTAALRSDCPPPGTTIPPDRLAGFPLTVGDRMVFEDRVNPRRPAREWVIELVKLHRNVADFELLAASGTSNVWQQDRAGNVTQAPEGSLQWPRLLRVELELGQVLAGDMTVAGNPQERARLRGQVVAVGPQIVGNRRFDVAVIELFGDATKGRYTTAVKGAMVVDRVNGLLLRLDLSSSNPNFALQRRLQRIQAAAPAQAKETLR